jgi:NhaA family Na+:H+ antiporter
LIKRRLIHPIRTLAEQGKLAGLLLILSTFLSLLFSNLEITEPYAQFWKKELSVLHWEFSVGHFINDGLMVIFFLLVGMEIKREVISGELAGVQKAMLPVMAALGGMLVPGFIYAACNINDTHLLHGWAIPTATDIAFSLGVLSLLGNKVPFGLKIFLTALAIIDDLGAIIIIALFYTDAEHFHINFLLSALIIIALLFILERKGFFNIFLWILSGIVVWYFILQSGVHATIAGVLIALTIPVKKLNSYEHALQPSVNYFILPVFALANTAIALSSESISGLFSTVGLGVMAGLFIGKPLGITFASWFAVKLKWCSLPNKISFKMLLGAGMTAGIGFTMSIFIASLSFKEESLLDASKIAIILASVFSAITGLFYLKRILESTRSKS